MTPTKAPAARRARDIGLDVRAPKARCDDRHCPFHGRLSLRGQVIEPDRKRRRLLSRELPHHPVLTQVTVRVLHRHARLPASAQPAQHRHPRPHPGLRG